MKQVVICRSDLAGEDQSYAICAVEIDLDVITLEEFERRARELMDAIREQDEYDDNDLIRALEDNGFTVVDCPVEITVRD